MGGKQGGFVKKKNKAIGGQKLNLNLKTFANFPAQGGGAFALSDAGGKLCGDTVLSILLFKKAGLEQATCAM